MKRRKERMTASRSQNEMVAIIFYPLKYGPSAKTAKQAFKFFGFKFV